MKLVTLLIVLVLIIVAYWLVCKYHIEMYEPKENPMKFNLIPRHKVPVKLRVMLNSHNEAAPPALDVTIPESFDAREKWPGLLTEPLDQADCGSCWAFSVSTTASDRIRISVPDLAPIFMKKQQYRGYNGLYTALNNLDPFHLAACDLCKVVPGGAELAKQALCGGGENSAPCAGEVLQVGMQYLQAKGTISVDCSPRQGPCLDNADMCFYNCDETTCKYYKAMSIHPISEEFTEEKTSDITRSNLVAYEIMMYGPTVAGYSVFQSFMDFFKDPKNAKKVYSQKVKDAYQGDDKNIGGHAISIIGWGVDDDGTKFWLIRNSWGQTWGDNGYFRMERGSNFCGIGDDVWASHWAKSII